MCNSDIDNKCCYLFYVALVNTMNDIAKSIFFVFRKLEPAILFHQCARDC